MNVLRIPRFGSRAPQHGGGSAATKLALAATFTLFCSAGALQAQNGERQNSVGEDAVDAVTQPLSDLGLRSRDIPLILTLAQDAPYNLAEVDSCPAMREEIARLEEVLGPDADAPQESRGLINRALSMGGDTLADFIPFRGLVRRVSGAHSHEKRWEEAVYAGVARRSYLKGVMAGRRCESEQDETIRTSREVLGLEE